MLSTSVDSNLSRQQERLSGVGALHFSTRRKPTHVDYSNVGSIGTPNESCGVSATSKSSELLILPGGGRCLGFLLFHGNAEDHLVNRGAGDGWNIAFELLPIGSDEAGRNQREQAL
jgi:hypothetical protein